MKEEYTKELKNNNEIAEYIKKRFGEENYKRFCLKRGLNNEK